MNEETNCRSFDPVRGCDAVDVGYRSLFGYVECLLGTKYPNQSVNQSANLYQ